MAESLPAEPNKLHNLLHELSRTFLNAVQQLSDLQPDASAAEPMHVDDAGGKNGSEQPANVLCRLLAAQLEARIDTGRLVGNADGTAECQRILDDFTAKLQAAACGLADSIERNTPHDIPDYCREPPSAVSMERMLALAHRLSYTSFAPPGFVPGVTLLGNFRPPAPQDWQLRAAQLHQFAIEHEQAQLRKEGQLPTAMTAEQPAAAAAAEVPPALLAGIPRMPPGWKPGDQLPGELPPMPPGWKVGDPLPGMHIEAPASAEPAVEQAAAPQVAAAPQMPSTAEPPRLQRPQLDASFLVLNPDLEEAVEEDYSTSEEESDDDDI